MLYPVRISNGLIAMYPVGTGKNAPYVVIFNPANGLWRKLVFKATRAVGRKDTSR